MIVDLHDDFPFESAKADIRIRAGDKVIYRKHTKVRMMPEKNTWDITKNGHVTEYAEGWNACLEEIEK